MNSRNRGLFAAMTGCLAGLVASFLVPGPTIVRAVVVGAVVAVVIAVMVRVTSGSISGARGPE